MLIPDLKDSMSSTIITLVVEREKRAKWLRLLCPQVSDKEHGLLFHLLKFGFFPRNWLIMNK